MQLVMNGGVKDAGARRPRVDVAVLTRRFELLERNAPGELLPFSDIARAFADEIEAWGLDMAARADGYKKEQDAINAAHLAAWVRSLA